MGQVSEVSSGIDWLVRWENEKKVEDILGGKKNRWFDSVVDETDKRIFLGSCTGTMDALGEGASGKLKPPLGAQSPSSVGSLGKAWRGLLLGQQPPYHSSRAKN